MATNARGLPPITAKELIALHEFITIPTYLIRELPPDKFYALADFLSMANENGEVHISVREFMKRWGWSNTKVTGFLKTITEKDIGKTEKRQKKDTVFIVNTGFLEVAKDRKKTEKRQKTITEKDKEQPEDTEIYKRIIEHLNMVCGTRYRCESEDSTKFIRERLDEGFSEEDFYDVIDKKANEWLGTQWEQYLRPYTLFRKEKFENYLNQKVQKKQETKNINASRQSQLEYLLNSIRRDEENERNGG